VRRGEERRGEGEGKEEARAAMGAGDDKTLVGRHKIRASWAANSQIWR
jgi:hypothetical protein